MTHTHLAIGACIVGGVTAANGMKGQLRHIAGFTGRGTAVLLDQVARGWFGVPHCHLIFVGNSITSGAGSTGGNTYPYYTAKALGLLGGKCSYANLGHSGETTQQLLARYASEVTPTLHTGSKNILVLNEIGNDIYLNGLTARQAVDNYWAYVAVARAAGIEVLASTCGPRALFSPAQLTTLLDANALVEAEFSANGCFDFADFGTIAEIQDINDTTYLADGTHPTSAGYSCYARVAADKLARRIAQL